MSKKKQKANTSCNPFVISTIIFLLVIVTNGLCVRATSHFTRFTGLLNPLQNLIHCPFRCLKKDFNSHLFFLQVNKETSMDSLLPGQRCSVVRPKERRPDIYQHNPFLRGNTIIRSKTFSPGPQSQYICRVTETQQHKTHKVTDHKGLWTLISLSFFCLCR